MSILFDRELTDKEYDFWRGFFTNFPSHYNRLLQKTYGEYSDINKIIKDYEKIKNSQSLDLISNNPDELKKAFKDYEQIFPAKLEEHFLLFTYGLACTDWDISIDKKQILIENKKDWSKSGITVTLAMCKDLMEGRILEFYSNLQDINPIKMTGEILLPLYNKKSTNMLSLKVESRGITQGYIYNGKYSEGFILSFSHSKESEKFLGAYDKQKELLDFICSIKLDKLLEKKPQTRKNKI